MQGRRPAHQEWSIRGCWEGAPHIPTMARCLQIVKILMIMIFTMKQYIWNTDMNTETTTKYWGGRHIFQWWPNLNISEVLWGCIWMCACMYAPLFLSQIFFRQYKVCLYAGRLQEGATWGIVQDLMGTRCSFIQTMPSQMVMKEAPRKKRSCWSKDKETPLSRSKPATILPNFLVYSGNDQRRWYSWYLFQCCINIMTSGLVPTLDGCGTEASCRYQQLAQMHRDFFSKRTQLPIR